MPEEKLKGEFVLTDPQENTEKKEELNSEITSSLFKRHDKMRFYSSLAINPEGVTFQDQEENEKIVILVRRDLITNLPWITATILLILFPLLITPLSPWITPFINISASTQLIATLFYYLIIFGFVLVEFILWYFNIGLVTNIRIIDVDVSGILSKHISETRLNIVEDVSYTQVGAIRSVFDYGDVFMQTAGTLTNFEFDRVPEPARVTRLVADLIGGAR